MTKAGLNTRRVTVHLGVPKTATTSIQRYLVANAGRLAPGLSVFTPGRGTPLNYLARMAVAYSQNPGEATERALVAAIVALRALIEEAPGNCLISHENLVGATPGRGSERGLFPAAAAILRLIDRHLAPLPVRYVAYTREIEAWKRSVHGQAIKTDGYTGPLETFLAETQAITGWDDLKRRLADAVGERVTFLDMETDVSVETPAESLLRLSGVAPEAIAALDQTVEPLNVRLLPASLEFIRQLNATEISPADRRLIVKVVKRNQSLFSSSFEPRASKR